MKIKNILLIVALLTIIGASGKGTPFYSLTATAKSSRTIELKWETFDIPTAYTVYRSRYTTSPWRNWKKVAENIYPPFKDTGLNTTITSHELMTISVYTVIVIVVKLLLS